MIFISSCRGMSVPTTPRRIPWFFCTERRNRQDSMTERETDSMSITQTIRWTERKKNTD